MRILISGAGIAGLTLAYWLRRAGHEPVVIEKAPALERRGFLIGIRGGSITVLQKMGVLDQALARARDTIHYHVLDAQGRRINGGRYLSYRDDTRGKLPLNRADLLAVLYEAVKDESAIHFATTLTALRPDEAGVEVELAGGQASGRYDLVIGADGVHSWVRRAVFGEAGPQPLKAAYAAFIAPAAGRVESYVQFAPGRMSVLYDLGHGQVGGLFILRELPEQRTDLKQHLVDLHRENGLPIAEVLRELPETTAIFADTLTAIRLPAWRQGRVGLVGDAAYCPTPASGFGATAALAGGYILAEALAAEGAAGLAAYERRLRPAIERRQREAASITGQLVTRSPVMMFVRETMLKLMKEDGVYKAKQAEMFGITA